MGESITKTIIYEEEDIESTKKKFVESIKEFGIDADSFIDCDAALIFIARVKGRQGTGLTTGYGKTKYQLALLKKAGNSLQKYLQEVLSSGGKNG